MWIKHFITQAIKTAKGNQRAKTARLTKVIKLKVIIKNPFTDLSNYKVIKEPKYALEIKPETNTELRLVTGIKTPLDTMFIALQDRRKRN